MSAEMSVNGGRLRTGLQATQQPETVKEVVTDTHPTEYPLRFGQTNHGLATQTATTNDPDQLDPSCPRYFKESAHSQNPQTEPAKVKTS